MLGQFNSRITTIALIILTYLGSTWALEEQASLTLTSTMGGIIVSPAAPLVVGTAGQWIDIEAQSTNPNYFVFSGWSGSAVEAGHVTDANLAQTSVYLDGNYDLRACFMTTQSELYVNDDANENPSHYGTLYQPLASIQDAIDLATDGMQIKVWPGRYTESLDFLGKNVELIAYNSNLDVNPVIDYNGPDPVLCFTGGEDANCLMQGFTITGGLGAPSGAIYCNQSSPSFYNCLVVANRCTDPNGGAILLDHSAPTWTNCTLVDNVGGTNMASMVLTESSPTLTNCIVRGNSPSEFIYDSNSTLSLRYCNVEGLTAIQADLSNSTGNQGVNPRFVDNGYWGHRDHPTTPVTSDDPNALWIEGDYHLESNSYCIDRGDPSFVTKWPYATDIDGDVRIQNDRVDMGAYEYTPIQEGSIFECPILKEIVLNELWWTDEPTPEDMKELTELYCYGNHLDEDVTSLVGLEYAINLQIFEITYSDFSDLSPLSGLIHLEHLLIKNNGLRSLEPLSGLTNLEYLDFHDNRVKDLTPLAGLTKLKTLITRGNGLSDITPLASLVNLEYLDLMQNNVVDLSTLLPFTKLEILHVNESPLSAESCNVILPQILLNNPNLTNVRHSCDPIKITFQSTAGGSIVTPGEGDFWYSYGETVMIFAQPDTGYTFTRFTGSLAGSTNPYVFSLRTDMTITANFEPIN